MSQPDTLPPELGAMSREIESWREGTRTIRVMTCACCEARVEVRTRNQKAQARKGRVYCSDRCRDRVVSASSSSRMSRTNRTYASPRMTQRNPMKNPNTREKVQQSLQTMGHKPPVQGGNGRGLTAPQAALLETAQDLTPEYVVATRMGRHSGYPNHYKIDLAHAPTKLAIEVDGYSHASLARRDQDRKKDRFLMSIGWTVLRFTNQEVMDDLEGVSQTVTSTISRLRATTTTSQETS